MLECEPVLGYLHLFSLVQCKFGVPSLMQDFMGLHLYCIQLGTIERYLRINESVGKVLEGNSFSEGPREMHGKPIRGGESLISKFSCI